MSLLIKIQPRAEEDVDRGADYLGKGNRARGLPFYAWSEFSMRMTTDSGGALYLRSDGWLWCSGAKKEQ